MTRGALVALGQTLLVAGAVIFGEAIGAHADGVDVFFEVNVGLKPLVLSDLMEITDIKKESNIARHVLAYSLLHFNGHRRTAYKEKHEPSRMHSQLCDTVNSQLQQLEQANEGEFATAHPTERDTSILFWFEASVVAQCTTQVSNSFRGKILEQLRLPLSSDRDVLPSEARERAYWAQVAAAAAAASLSPAANATTVAAAFVSFGIHHEANDLNAVKLIDLSMAQLANQSDAARWIPAVYILQGAGALVPRRVMSVIPQLLQRALELDESPAKATIIASILLTYLRQVLRARATEYASWPQDGMLVMSIQRAVDLVATDVNDQISSFRQRATPSDTEAADVIEGLLPHLQALSAASYNGMYIAHTDYTSSHLRLCDVMGHALQLPVEVLAKLTEKEGDRLIPMKQIETSYCTYAIDRAFDVQGKDITYYLKIQGKIRAVGIKNSSHGHDKQWQGWRLLNATVQYPGHDPRRVDLSIGTLQQPLEISAPGVLRLTVTLSSKVNSADLEQAALLLSLVNSRDVSPVIPRVHQFPVSRSSRNTLRFQLELGDPDVLPFVSGTYHIELMLAQSRPYRAQRSSITYIDLSFPASVSQIAVRVPRWDRAPPSGMNKYSSEKPTQHVTEYHILPPEQPLHPFPLVDFVCQAPPVEGPLWMSILFVVGASLLPTGVLLRFWFDKLGANFSLMKTEAPDLMFICILALLAGIFMYYLCGLGVYYFILSLIIIALPFASITIYALHVAYDRRCKGGRKEA